MRCEVLALTQTNYFSALLTMQEILHKNRCLICYQIQRQLKALFDTAFVRRSFSCSGTLNDKITTRNSYFQRDILKIERENKGGTMTHLALDKVVSDDLKTMRADAMKVVIVVTDGESTKPELTKKSAALLKSVCFVLNFHLSEV